MELDPRYFLKDPDHLQSALSLTKNDLLIIEEDNISEPPLLCDCPVKSTPYTQRMDKIKQKTDSSVN